ncbi:thyroid transcription factor 1-associated protein 26 [Nycticebus coucang]|uniref:thyroid transcription factor 1-associated protein 26 n=1 Tax=Nycticebus coucang TaxID=9470 RepID=UPI00234C2F09|nr:thyroid transcription factor 1-associated protein 26 [Nycticebus coucang]
MAPVRPAQWRRKGGLETLGEEDFSVGFKNKNVKQRIWRPNYSQAFVGSIREGQGFAFRRKLKIQQNYKKLLWRQKTKTSQESQFKDRYPDHLKHLYLAEEERLKKQQRKVNQPLSAKQVDQLLPEEQCSIDQALSQDHCSFDQPQPEKQSIKTVKSFNLKKKKTSNQKAQEEYEQVQARRAAKKQEFERRKQEREEAQRCYKKKKMEVFKILSKKTKKGQPNLNLQMEYLLQKIQEKN